MGKAPKPFPLDEETIEFPSFKAELSEIDIARLTLAFDCPDRCQSPIR
jgi:hypothetical protein